MRKGSRRGGRRQTGRKEAGLVWARRGGSQDRSDAKPESVEQEGCRTGGIHDRRDE